MMCQNFNLLVHCHSKLWLVKVMKSDVCGSLVFSNPVTNRHDNTTLMHVLTIAYISLKPTWKYTKFVDKYVAICKGYSGSKLESTQSKRTLFHAKFVILSYTHSYYWSPIHQRYPNLKILQNSPLLIAY